MEEHGLVDKKDRTKGRAANEAGGDVVKGRAAKEAGVQEAVDGVGVLEKKREGKKGGEEVKGGKEKKPKRKEKQKTNGDEGAGLPSTGGGTGPPAEEGADLGKRQKQKDKKSKNKEGEEEGRCLVQDTPEHTQEQLLLIEAKPHKRLVVNLSTGDPWSVQVRVVCFPP